MPETLAPTAKLDPVSIRFTAFEAETIVPDLMAYFGETRTAVMSRALFYLWSTHCKDDTNLPRIRELYEALQERKPHAES